MMPVTEPLRLKNVRIKALRSEFYINGHLAAVGEECVLPPDVAEPLVARDVAEVIGEAPDTVIPIRDLVDPPRRDGGWMTGA